jgi:uncharacterized membrane protein
MDAVVSHITRRLIAGVIACLPIGGTLFTVWWLEDTISDMWLVDQPYYFPGLGLVAVAVLLYLIGLWISSFIGRWIWGRVDRLLEAFPALGVFYRTLKQVLGYGEGRDALFEKTVWVPSEVPDAWQLGLVTGRVAAPGGEQVLVFIPGSPNPTTGRLISIEPDRLKPAPLSVNDALTGLVSLGKTNLPEPGTAPPGPQQ